MKCTVLCLLTTSAWPYFSVMARKIASAVTHCFAATLACIMWSKNRVLGVRPSPCNGRRTKPHVEKLIAIPMQLHPRLTFEVMLGKAKGTEAKPGR